MKIYGILVISGILLFGIIMFLGTYNCDILGHHYYNNSDISCYDRYGSVINNLTCHSSQYTCDVPESLQNVDLGLLIGMALCFVSAFLLFIIPEIYKLHQGSKR